MKKEEVTKEGLSNALDSLFKSFKESSKNDAMSTEIFKFLENNKNWMKNPDVFNTMVYHKFENIIHELVEQKYDYADDTMKYIYSNYSIYESLIRGIVESNEGSCCCADKSRFVLKSYFEYAKTKKLPEYNTENYWVPNKGSNHDWIGFVLGITKLIYGNPSEYLIRMNVLVNN